MIVFEANTVKDGKFFNWIRSIYLDLTSKLIFKKWFWDEILTGQ